MKLPGRHGKRALGGLLGIGFIALVFLVLLPRIASYQDVLDAVSRLTWTDALALAAAVVVNVVTFAPPWMAALPGLRFWPALVVTQASTAASSVVPGGEAVGIGLSVGMLRGWRFEPAAVALATILVTVWNVFAKIGFPLLAVGLLTLEGATDRTLSLLAPIAFVVLLVATAAVVAAFWSEAQARRIGGWAEWAIRPAARLLRRQPPVEVGASVARFRGNALVLLRRRWLWLTLATAVGHLSTFALLLVLLRALGTTADEVTLIEAFAAWSLVRLLTVIPITPGWAGRDRARTVQRADRLRRAEQRGRGGCAALPAAHLAAHPRRRPALCAGLAAHAPGRVRAEREAAAEAIAAAQPKG